MSAKWKLPKSRNALESLLRDPKEGNFWQVDHIIAVSEGGGGCGLENLRTLCVPCHDKETEDLRRRLRLRSPSTKEGDGCTEKSKQSNLNQYFTGKTKPGAC
jgi:5-methylcytosine-specific restriction endonuclease McrA